MHTPSPMLTTLSRGGDCPRPGVGGLPSAALNKGGTAAETPEYLGPHNQPEQQPASLSRCPSTVSPLWASRAKHVTV